MVLRDHTLYVPALLAVKLDVLTVGIQVAGHLPLEVGHAVNVVARQDLDVHLFQDRLRPLGFVVHLAQKGENGLVSRGLVSVDRGLEIDSKLLLFTLVGSREVEVRNGTAFFGQEIGALVGDPVVLTGKRADEEVWNRSVVVQNCNDAGFTELNVISRTFGAV